MDNVKRLTSSNVAKEDIEDQTISYLETESLLQSDAHRYGYNSKFRANTLSSVTKLLSTTSYKEEEHSSRQGLIMMAYNLLVGSAFGNTSKSKNSEINEMDELDQIDKGVEMEMENVDILPLISSDSHDDTELFNKIQGLPFLRSIYLLVQGVLGGFAFVSLYQQAAAANDTDFLVAYQEIAADHRRFFYILTSAALVGSGHICISVFGLLRTGFQGVKNTKATSNLREAVILIAPIAAINVGFHGLAFIVNLIMATFDTLVAHKNGYMSSSGSDTEWIPIALEEKGFSEALSSWKILERIRLVAALGAWIGCCLLTWFNQRLIPTIHEEQIELKDSLAKWKQIAKELQGNGTIMNMYLNLNDKTIAKNSLRKLIDMQENGLQRARATLDELVMQK